MKPLFIALFAFFVLGSPQWTTDMNKAKVDAAAANKMIVLNFSGSDGCGPCSKLKQEVLDSPEFLKYAETELVLVRADFPRQKKNQLDAKPTAQNEMLAEKYNPKGKFPLVVLINAQGKAIKEWEGYPKNMTPASLIAEIKNLK